MPNFLIKFALEIRTDRMKYREGNGQFIRIISSQTKQIAEKLAEAMIGEEVYSCQYLSEVLSVTSTQEEPSISPFYSSDCVWERVLQRLGLVGTGETVRFLHHQTASVVITPGIVFTSDQIQRIFSCVLKP